MKEMCKRNEVKKLGDWLDSDEVCEMLTITRLHFFYRLCRFSLNFLQNRFNKVRIYRKGVPDRPQSYKKLSRKRLNNLAVSKECANFASV